MPDKTGGAGSSGTRDAITNRARYESFKSQLRFDPLRIDDELMEYPALVQEVNELLSTRIAARDALDHEVDLIKAQVETRIRRSSGENKITENAVKSAVLLDREVIAITQYLQDARQDVGAWTALSDAFKQKSYSMARYAELLIAGFIARDSALKEREQEIASNRQPSPRMRRV